MLWCLAIRAAEALQINGVTSERPSGGRIQSRGKPIFRLLIRRNLPSLLVRIMLNFYISNFVRVSWCGYFSEYFLATNGVKQGGVLSPVLFCVYLDELLHALSEAKVGCYIGDIFVGALAYADDLVLTAPSANALRKMLAICDAYASDYCMNFNGSFA